ncbi:glycosyltransferase [Neobacillus cucumis]|uniref:glycosyltransferase n=1 Tax=Neobacillus cucumis TaxID=1740721 RepID=UPI00203B4EF1|nr:glycosyltransferase [Neobacillus cucumis]MCM3729748.1 glycosyltransferase [Neobacillus cucumis]
MAQGYLNFQGNEIVTTKNLFKNIKNDFTYEFWVEPQKEIDLTKHYKKNITDILQQQYVIGPGNPELNQENEAGTGVSVGRNGVAVYELSQNYLSVLLTYKIEIKGWTHIAIVFENNTPRLYVNGQYKIKGITSSKKKVFASGKIGGLDPNGYFEGKINDVRIWNYPKTHGAVKSFMKNELRGNEPGLSLYLNYQKQTFVVKPPSQLNPLSVDPSFLQDNVLNQYSLQSFNKINYINVKEELFQDIQIDVIIPIYNAYELTKKCIETVLNQSNITYNLYLINDASSDVRIFSMLENLKAINLPENLNKLVVIHNDTNLGFVQSVNRGLLLSTNHSIVLNSDTEIPPDCFRRLIYPILINDTVASVTPFSNSATICSFPVFNEDNPIPYNMSVEEIDYFFSKYSINKGIEIPTAVGFCMVLNRNILNQIGIFDDDVFGKGYGEENDWCLRASNKGYKHILMPNIFVFHKHGASFNGIKDDAKKELMTANLKKLLARYPNYNRIVQQFIALDPAKNIRDFMRSILAANSSSDKKGVLLVNHNLGGGTEVYESNYIKKIGKEQRVYTLKPQKNHLVLIDHNHDEPIQYPLDLNLLNEINFQYLLRTFLIEEIFINHLLGFPLDKMFLLVQKSSVPYYFFVHDFYSVCPSYNLINQNKKYCGAETDIKICQACIQNINKKQYISIKDWRDNYHSFLMNATKVFAPSDNTKDIMVKYYPGLNVEVREHSIEYSIKNTFREEFLSMRQLNIAFIGALGFEKGSKIIYELHDLIIKENLPINIKVIGYTNLHYHPHISKDGKLEITGKYQAEQLPSLLEKYKIALVINPSICPETYSYTTSEALLAGYPVITFNIGAPADRIKNYKCGWIIDNISSKELLALLRRLISNREEIIVKAEILRQIKFNA